MAPLGEFFYVIQSTTTRAQYVCFKKISVADLSLKLVLLLNKAHDSPRTPLQQYHPEMVDTF